ncbi:MAG: aconitase X catalytic domain-containing protein [Methanoregulaceae archaeon]|nr:aconitase X catalytic domain-containing protein [Methanoregulaceae archaeon]
MHLDRDDEQTLAGEFGGTRQKMMEILVALGKVFGAEGLVPIRSAQVSGASYKTIGKYGLEWLSSLDAQVAVPTVLNPIGMDRERWREMGITKQFADRQAEVIAVYRRLGVRLECTCTPYYLFETGFGEHIAWSESSAVAYANSVLGARTNREGGPSALAAAIIGKTPYYGLHLVENRVPALVVELPEDVPLDSIAHYGALGHAVGKIAGNRIPCFRSIRPDRDRMKALGAAMAASGAVALFHVQGITPDARIFRYDLSGLERVTIEKEELLSIFHETPVEAVAIGCPHCSEAELAEIAGLLEGRHVNIPLFVFASRGVIGRSRSLIASIERSGARVFADTCMVVSPGLEQFSSIMVNSGKAYAYVPNMCGAVVRIGTTGECVEVAVSPPKAAG